jgi:hypothetical protein
MVKKTTNSWIKCVKATTKFIEFTKKFARLLEIKWEMIKHDVMKFCTCYKAVVVLNEFGTFQKYTLQNALEFYKLKHPKHTNLTFSSCYIVLKNVHGWANMEDDMRKPPLTK